MSAVTREENKNERGGRIIRLIAVIEQILKDEQRQGQSKLRSKISDIKEKRPFFEFPAVFLPAKGEAIFIGDTHGDSLAVKAIIKQENFLERAAADNNVYLVFLGDYADRGKADIENLEFIITLKKQYPSAVFLLRGNHEESSVGQYYGLLSSCIDRFGYEKGRFVFQQFNKLFEKLPVIAITAGGIIALHGGVPIRGAGSLKELNNEECLAEIRWNDPSEEIDYYVFNYKRGGYYLFGRKIFDAFMSGAGGGVLIRSHEYVADGCKFLFDNKLLSIFSNGGKSSESGYGDFVFHPKYAKVNLSKSIKRWTKDEVFDIKY